LILKALQNFQVIAVTQRAHGLADLRARAPQRDFAIAGVGHFVRTFRMMEPKKNREGDHEEENETNDQLSHQRRYSGVFAKVSNNSTPTNTRDCLLVTENTRDVSEEMRSGGILLQSRTVVSFRRATSQENPECRVSKN
jgi:hypothetical protein